MLAQLQSIPLFQSLQMDDLRDLADRAKLLSLPKDRAVLEKGAPVDSLYIVLSGSVKIFIRDETGAELILVTKVAKQYFGEMMLDHRPRSASVTTLEPTQLAVISHADFKRFLRKSPDAAEHVILNLIQIARSMNDRTMTIPQRARQYSDKLPGVDASEGRDVKRWMTAKWWVLSALLVYGVMQYYFLEVFLEMLSTSSLVIFR
jgi:CRP-like cAMP-binding protein